MFVGASSPAPKLSSMICAPIFDSALSGNPSIKLKFGFMLGAPAANTTRSASVTANVATGRRVTTSATRDQMPRVLRAAHVHLARPEGCRDPAGPPAPARV